ncbi:hypothetical protein GCM10020229_70440 [Kitasatospora albolonga]
MLSSVCSQSEMAEAAWCSRTSGTNGTGASSVCSRTNPRRACSSTVATPMLRAFLSPVPGSYAGSATSPTGRSRARGGRG